MKKLMKLFSFALIAGMLVFMSGSSNAQTKFTKGKTDTLDIRGLLGGLQNKTGSFYLGKFSSGHRVYLDNVLFQTNQIVITPPEGITLPPDNSTHKEKTIIKSTPYGLLCLDCYEVIDTEGKTDWACVRIPCPENKTSQNNQETIFTRYDIVKAGGKTLDVSDTRNGSKTFVGHQGSKLVVTVKENIPVKIQFYVAGGTEVAVAGIPTAKASCRVCTSISTAGDVKHTRTFCFYVPCDTAEKINKGMSSMPTK